MTPLAVARSERRVMVVRACPLACSTVDDFVDGGAAEGHGWRCDIAFFLLGSKEKFQASTKVQWWKATRMIPPIQKMNTLRADDDKART